MILPLENPLLIAAPGHACEPLYQWRSERGQNGGEVAPCPLCALSCNGPRSLPAPLPHSRPGQTALLLAAANLASALPVSAVRLA